MTDTDFTDTPVAETGQENTAPPKKGFQVREKHRLHHAVGGSYTDFDNEQDLLDFVNEAHTVKEEREPDGSTRKVYSPNAHLVHGAAHKDYPNLRAEVVREVYFPEDDE